VVTFHPSYPTALLGRPADNEAASLLGAEAGDPQIEQQPGRPWDAGLLPEHAVGVSQLDHQRDGPELLGGDDLRRVNDLEQADEQRLARLIANKRRLYRPACPSRRPA
jgi:hypothetical protein